MGYFFWFARPPHHHAGNSNTAPYFFFKSLAFATPSPLEFPLTFNGGGMDINLFATAHHTENTKNEFQY